jgi:Zn-dependent M16 (insulinase) family peptidase
MRLRIESCVSIILDLNNQLGAGKIKPEIIRQFERLKDTVQHLSEDKVSEEDIHKIEQATNDLLADLQATYSEAQSPRLSPKECH